MPGCKVFRRDESDLLRKFWELTAPPKRQRPRLISFNGRGYDLPWLAIRSAMLGVKIGRPIESKPWERHEHVDLMDVLTFGGAARDRFKLEYWCRRFGIESPKTMLDGSQVSGAYRQGRIEDIGEYCLRDTRATAELYRKLKPSLLDS
jgi:hypothetical protein